jgi:hypothetical protein
MLATKLITHLPSYLPSYLPSTNGNSNTTQRPQARLRYLVVIPAILIRSMRMHMDIIDSPQTPHLDPHAPLALLGLKHDPNSQRARNRAPRRLNVDSLAAALPALVLHGSDDAGLDVARVEAPVGLGFGGPSTAGLRGGALGPARGARGEERPDSLHGRYEGGRGGQVEDFRGRGRGEGRREGGVQERASSGCRVCGQGAVLAFGKAAGEREREGEHERGGRRGRLVWFARAVVGAELECACACAEVGFFCFFAGGALEMGAGWGWDWAHGGVVSGMVVSALLLDAVLAAPLRERFWAAMGVNVRGMWCVCQERER